MTCEVFVPYFLQRLHGQSPLASGYMSALMALGWTVSEIISAGWKGAKMRASILLGPIFVLAGLVLLALTLSVPSAGTWAIMSPILLGLSLVGFGIGFGWPHLLTGFYRSRHLRIKRLPPLPSPQYSFCHGTGCRTGRYDCERQWFQ